MLVSFAFPSHADHLVFFVQWTVGGTKHNVNGVLCRQAECPPELGLPEFVAFGSLRAGCRLQLRNILHAVETRSLSFDTSAVGVLVSQALWEAGPRGDACESWRRDSHADGGVGPFGVELVSTVSQLLESVADNWEQHRVLLVLVTILCRVMALTDDNSSASLAASALRRCRQVASAWATCVEGAIVAVPADAPLSACAGLRERLVDICCTGALTYDVDQQHLPLVLGTHQGSVASAQEDVAEWLRTVARIHDNTLLGVGLPPASLAGDASRRLMLLRRVDRAALRLYPRLQRVLPGPALTAFVGAHWADGCRGTTRVWRAYSEPNGQWYHTKLVAVPGEQCTVLQLDVLRGTFLVDGAPVGRLPSTISGHQDFQRVFGRIILEVQPALGRPGAFVTAQPRGGSFFLFSLEAESRRLVVEERRPDDRVLALFPARFLDGDLPRALVDQYSHWLCGQELLFRPRLVSSGDFAGSGAVGACTFSLDAGPRTVSRARHQARLVDVRGKSFAHIYTSALRRLADRRDVHMWRATGDGAVTVELVRLRLHLEVAVKDGAVLLCSRELPGFHVSTEQGVGTLTGLDHGLVLVDGASGVHERPRRRLVIPHGSLTQLPGAKAGRVTVDVDGLAEPPFFLYDVADRLRLLQPTAPSRTALLYLALLHARTSNSLPDAFTGMSGTEAALRLLQGGSCWSSAPPSAQDCKLLQDIKAMAPRRSFYPAHLQSMETAVFPRHLQSAFTYEALSFAALALERDGAAFPFLYPAADRPAEVDAGQLQLSTKAYWRGRDMVGPEQRLNAATERLMGLSFPPAISRGTLWSLFQPSIRIHFDAIRALARIDETAPTKEASVATLLESVDNLDGWRLALDVVRDHGNTVTSWRDVQGERHWLGIYEFCRRAGSPAQVRFLLSLLVWRGQLTVADAATLQWVSLRRKEFEAPPPDDYFLDTSNRQYRFEEVRKLISGCEFPCDLRGVDEDDEDEVADAREEHRRRRDAAAWQLEAVACAAWPTDAVVLYGAASCGVVIDLDAASSTVSARLQQWFRNHRLHEWLCDVDQRVSRQYLPPSQALMPFVSTIGRRVALPSANRYAVRPAAWRWGHSQPSIFVWARAVFSTGAFEAAAEVDEQALPPPRLPSLVPPFPNALTPAPAEADAIVEHSRAALRSSWVSWQQLQSSHAAAASGAAGRRPRTDWQGQATRALTERRRRCSAQAHAFWMAAKQGLSPTTGEEEALFSAGLWSRLVPANLLPRLVGADVEGADEAALLGSAAVCWTLAARAERCLALLGGGEEAALRRELQNRGRHNWVPEKRPEWLLLELEQGWLVREVQCTVASRMLSPEYGEFDEETGVSGGSADFEAGANAVLQLNMGEGKTAVLLPLLAATLADGKSLFRCTVLRALLRSNADALTVILGGLLGRRVWAFPCHRDLRLGSSEASILLQAYQRCAEERGIVVTLPEHRLSFQLMALERCNLGDTDGGVGLRGVLDWLGSHARDCLDESDSILGVRYQLVYAMGSLLPLGGGTLRWRVMQGVLRLVRRHAGTLLTTYGEDAVELGSTADIKGGAGAAFTPLRILDAAVYPHLCELVVDDVLEGRGLDIHLQLPILQSGEKALLRRLLLVPCVEQGDIDEALSPLPAGKPRDTLLALRGLLSFNVLLLALQKRYRVNYGVRPSAIEAFSTGVTKRGPEARLMAVPFRAKDVPAERAEFSHSCLALALTHLSYYSAGLTNDCLDDCFARLLRLDSAAAEAEYLRWVAALDGDLLAPVNAARFISASVRSLPGVNLSDHAQRLILYPLLSRNMAVIDFWLNSAVFPVEAKVFPGRLSASAWDLCRRGGNSVVGFSGTNESALLLPPSIAQRDLPQLQHTSGMVVASLLQPENQGYMAMPACASGVDILDRISVDGRTRVLLDVGALMKELDNAGVAAAWLARASPDEIDAAIFFEESSNLCVAVDRSGVVTALAVSPFYHRLDRCITFLDESHTRGTDFRFPAGTHAAVTLGRGITKDRLVQAAMRMRRLGQTAGGHTLSFIASAEVHASIVAEGSGTTTLGSVGVVLWALRNSEAFLRDGFLHWAGRGLDRTRAITAERVAGEQDDATPLQVFGELHVQAETVELARLYGRERQRISSATSIRLRSAALTDEMCGRLPPGRAPLVKRNIAALTRVLTSHCDAFLGATTRLEVVLDEEQERELEQELEEEREVERPPLAEPRVPTLHPDVARLARCGGAVRSSSEAFEPVTGALKGTSFAYLVEKAAWGDALWCTAEYCRVLAFPENHHMDGYLRPPAWLLVTAGAAVLLHPFEVNALLPIVRQGSGGASRLHQLAARRRPGQRCLALTRGCTIPVPGQRQAMSYLLRSCAAPVLVQAAVLGGTLYFCCPAEAAAYSAFLGLALQPHSAAVTAALSTGDVGRDGFVRPAARARILPAALTACPFAHSPVRLARRLVDARHYSAVLAYTPAGAILDRGQLPVVNSPSPIESDDEGHADG